MDQSGEYAVRQYREVLGSVGAGETVTVRHGLKGHAIVQFIDRTSWCTVPPPRMTFGRTWAEATFALSYEDLAVMVVA